MDTVLKLLQLEDDSCDAELIEKFLRRSGLEFTTTVVSDKLEYLAAIRNNVFDAILADNSLPEFNSSDALNHLQKEGVNSAFILVTGTVSEEFAVDIIHKGADDYILKRNLTRLPSAIMQAIEKKRMLRDKLDAEAGLVRSERRYRTLFQRNLAGIYQSTADGRIIDCNNAFCRMLGYGNPGEMRRINSRDLYFSEIEMRQFIARIHYEKFLSNFEVTLRKRDGSPVYVIGNISLVENNEIDIPIIEGIMINITDRKTAEEDLKKINLELHDLSSHLQNIREEERIEIARDIHDELGQQLTGLKMDVYSLDQQIRSDDPAIKKKFSDILGLIEVSVNSVRKITAHLRPAILDDLGLVAALEWHSQEIQTRFDLTVTFIPDRSEIEAPPAVTTGLFRIYQEALTNAVRHSEARAIDSSIKIVDDTIILEIKDDGKGTDINAIGKVKSYGLLGIKERVHVMKGQYKFKSEPGKGTSLYISVPL
ncbi:MAG TPA: histidine kinase [Puia sp.]|nr:histidine kinase [Puia sp.]